MPKIELYLPEWLVECLESSYGKPVREALLLLILEVLAGVLERDFDDSCILEAQAYLARIAPEWAKRLAARWDHERF